MKARGFPYTLQAYFILKRDSGPAAGMGGCFRYTEIYQVKLIFSDQFSYEFHDQQNNFK